MTRIVGKVIDLTLNVLAVCAGALLIFITISISYSILSRAIGISSPVWIVQFNEYSLVWITFLGAGWALARNKHVAIDLLTRKLGNRRRAALERVHSFLGAGICGALFWYSAQVTWGQYQRGVTDVQAIDVPKYLVLLVIPLGFLLLAVQFLRQLIIGAKVPGTGAGEESAEAEPGAAPFERPEKDS